MRELSLFSGVGGGLLGSRLLGWKTVAAVEVDPFCRLVLEKRQQDGLLEPFPVFEDVRTFDPQPWAGSVDVVSSSFPCQDISIAGKGAGIDGPKSSLYWESWKICLQLRADYFFVENSPALLRRGFSRILGEMAQSGWDAEWLIMGAGCVGAPHIRDRLWLLAGNPNRQSQPARAVHDKQASWVRPLVANPNNKPGLELQSQRPFPDGQRNHESCKERQSEQRSRPVCNPWQAGKPYVCRVDDGMARRMDRLRAIGNGQVPLVAATAFRILHARLES